jgi:YEATS domain-containing protein 4
MATTIESPVKSSTQMSQAPRMTKTTVCLPIVYGSIAFPLKKVEEYNTHIWYLYIRGPSHEDLSSAISKVIFQLHPSFAQPVREIFHPPYTVTEKGWGEFEVTIRVYWKDESEKPLVLTTPLKLYPSAASDNKHSSLKDGEPVIHETYDEVVFTDPTEIFYKQLILGHGGGSLNDSYPLTFPKVYFHEASVQERLPLYSDEDDVKALLEAQKFLSTELSSVKDRILKAKQAKAELDQALVSAAALKKGATGAAVGYTVQATGNTKTSIADIGNNTFSDSAMTSSNLTAPKNKPSKRAKKTTTIRESNET